MSHEGVDHVDELLHLNEAVAQVLAGHPLGGELHRAVGVPVVGEPGHGVTLAARAVADDQPGETDARMLGSKRLDQLVQCRLAHRVGAQAGPGRGERRAHRREVDGDALALGSGAGSLPSSPGRHRSHWCRTRVARCRRPMSVSAGQGSDGRRVDEGVDASQMPGRLGEGRLARFGIGHVAGQGDRPWSRFFGRGLEALDPPGEQGRLCTPFGQADADAASQSTRSAYDDGAHCLVPPVLSSEGMLGGIRQGHSRAAASRRPGARCLSAECSRPGHGQGWSELHPPPIDHDGRTAHRAGRNLSTH